MRPVERARRLVLGEPVEPPPELCEECEAAGIALRRGSLVTRIAGMLGGMGRPAAAVTLRRTIVLDRAARLTPSLLAHELAHVEQWRRDPLFPLRYAAASLRHGYWNNPYEIEARAATPSATCTPSVEETP